MIALSGLAWLAIGLGIGVALAIGIIVCLLAILVRYEPHFGIEPLYPPQDAGHDE